MMQGLMGGIADKFRGDEGSARLYGLGLLASQLGAGQTPDASPALAMLDQRKAQKAFKASMSDPGMMDMFNDQERAFLSTLPPQAAQQLIAQRVFAAPADPFSGTQVINGQLVGMGEDGPQVLGDFNTPEPGYTQLSAEEAAARGLDPQKGWQVGGDGKISEIGGAGVNITNTVGGEGLTPFQEKTDEAFATDYLEWNQGGGADMQGQLAQVGTVLDRLESGEELTGPMIGSLPDWALAITNPDAANAKEQIEEVVQRNLRLILGAQFTEKEGERLIARAYNPRLSARENAPRLRRLFMQMQAAAEQKQAMVDYASENGTLMGYSGSVPSFEDFMGALAQGASPTAETAAPESVPAEIWDVMTPEERALFQ